MSKPAEIEALFAFAADRFGGIDILVNNAGIQHVANVEDFPVDKWDSIIAINLTSAFHTSRLALPFMRKKNWGRIINLASAHGLVGSAGKSAYVAAKHGLVGLTKVTSLETAQTGVTANAICPGFVLTPLVENQIEEQARAHGIPVEKVVTDVILASQPNKRFSTVQEIGALAAFLCGPGAGTITGTSLSVDGGWTAH
jgi:3-hydroxybutyrate dehydrogenase